MRNCRRVTTSEFIAYIGTQPVTEARFGFVVSKSVGSAVVRNRVKRQLRAAAAAKLPKLAPTAIVLRATPAAVTANFSQLSSSLESALAGVLR